MKVIAIVGEKGSGKDYLASLLVDHYSASGMVSKYAFADKLKEDMTEEEIKDENNWKKKAIKAHSEHIERQKNQESAKNLFKSTGNNNPTPQSPSAPTVDLRP